MLTAQNCTIAEFMRMWFDESGTNPEFESIHLEYVDLSGLTKSRELELNAQVYNLQTRVEKVKWIIYALRVSVSDIGIPAPVFIEMINKYGHRLEWNNSFESQLQKIEGREAKYAMQLEEKKSELDAFARAQSQGKTTITQTRDQFIKNIIELRKRGHYIIESQTTVETLALIIKCENDEAQRLESEKSKKK